MPEEKKQRLKEYQKNYRGAKKISFIDAKNQFIVLSKKDSKLLSQRHILLVLLSIL